MNTQAILEELKETLDHAYISSGTIAFVYGCMAEYLAGQEWEKFTPDWILKNLEDVEARPMVLIRMKARLFSTAPKEEV